MKEVFLTFAKYNEEANQKILAILDKMSNDDREKERGNYFGSLSGLVRHVLGGTVHFQGMFKAAVSGNAAAQKAFAPLDGITIPEGKLNESQWKSLSGIFSIADSALVNFIAALSDADYKAPVKLDWYGGNPSSVPLYFMLQQLVAHGTHHQGQISQILDELKIDNDYSGINVAFL